MGRQGFPFAQRQTDATVQLLYCGNGTFWKAQVSKKSHQPRVQRGGIGSEDCCRTGSPPALLKCTLVRKRDSPRSSNALQHLTRGSWTEENPAGTAVAETELFNIQGFYDIENLLLHQLPEHIKNHSETQDDHNKLKVQLNNDTEVIVTILILHIHLLLIPISRLGCLGVVT